MSNAKANKSKEIKEVETSKEVKRTVIMAIKEIASTMETDEVYKKQEVISAVLESGISTQSSCNENIGYLTVNNSLRTKYGANKNARSKSNENDVFISFKKGELELYDAKKHGVFGITEDDNTPSGFVTIESKQYAAIIEKRTKIATEKLEAEKKEKAEAKAKVQAEKEAAKTAEREAKAKTKKDADEKKAAEVKAKEAQKELAKKAEKKAAK